MELKILYALDKGDLKKERLVLKATDKLDIGNFLVLDSTFSEDDIPTNLLRHCFWFPDKEIKSGDKIILYTKDGNDSETISDSGHTSHFFYWGLKETVWNVKEDGAVIIKADSWIYKKV